YQIWSLSFFHPLFKRSEHVKTCRSVSAATVAHSRNHKEAIVGFHFVDSAHLIENTLVVINAAAWSNLRIGPAVIVNELSAASEECVEIWIHRVDIAGLGLVHLRHVAIKSECLVIPLRIVEHHELVHLKSDAEWLLASERVPTHFTAWLECREDLFLGAGIHERLIHHSRRFHLCRTQAVCGIAGCALQNLRVELALPRIFEHPIFNTIFGVACFKYGVMHEREFALGEITFFSLVVVLSDPYGIRSASGCVESRGAADNTVEVLRKLLCRFERLPSAGGATIEVRESRVVSVKRGDDGFRFFALFMHGPIPEVDEFVLVLHPRSPAPLVSRICTGRRIPASKPGCEGVLIDVAIPAAIADRFEFPVPVGRRQPYFNLDIGIGGGLNSRGHLAECR